MSRRGGCTLLVRTPEWHPPVSCGGRSRVPSGRLPVILQLFETGGVHLGPKRAQDVKEAEFPVRLGDICSLTVANTNELSHVMCCVRWFSQSHLRLSLLKKRRYTIVPDQEGTTLTLGHPMQSDIASHLLPISNKLVHDTKIEGHVLWSRHLENVPHMIPRVRACAGIED